MKTQLKKSFPFPVMTLLALLTVPATAAETTLHFSDPSQPGHLVIQAAFGDIVIVGEDTSDVTIQSDESAQETEQPREDGLRRLDSDSGFSASESDNVITLTLGGFMMGGRHGARNAASDVTITVPRQTAVTIERAGAGDAEVRNVTGDLELRGTIGDVQLDGISGGLLVETSAGDIDATFTGLPEAKPVSITTVNGDVSLNVPAESRANVRFRTLHGEMLTDFSEAELETRFENTGTVFKEDAKSTGTAAVANAEKAKVAAEQQRKLAEMQRGMAAEQRAAAKATEKTVETQVVVPSPQPMPMGVTVHVPRIPNLPPMAGGKLLVGTLNGGGTDLLITTLNGTITLRKQE